MNKQNQIYLQSLKQGIKTIFEIGESQETNACVGQAEKFLNIGELAPEGEYLTNIFAKIYGNEQSFFHLKPLDLEKETFEPKSEKKDDFKKLKTDFETEYDKIPKNSLETLFYLLKKYLSFVPVNKDHTYINAFEFLKLRSAFAQCLYDFEQDKTTEELPFLMLCIDISGIQGFIYNIASGKAAKSLKGRSFYLQLLMDSLIQKVIQVTQKANIGHIIYASGGKAYLLLPNLESVRNAIENLEKEVERKIFEEHKESLYVLMDWVEFGYDNQNKVLVNEETKKRILEKKQKNPKETNKDEILIADLWIELGDKTAKKKYRKYNEFFKLDKTQKAVLESENKGGEYFCFEDFFEPNDEDGFDTSDTKKTVCAVTGEVIEKPTKDKNLLKELENGEKVWVTAKVKEQSELGKKLKEISFYVTYNGEKRLSKNAQKYTINPVNLEILSYIRDDEDFIREYLDTGNIRSINYSLVRKVNDTDFLNTLKGKDASYGFTFYGGNKQALKANGDEKDYEELTGLTNEEDKGKGFRRLGILRMDVDGLGGLFADKMKKNNLQNFPAYAMVSAHLENFFAGYLNTIRNDKEKEYKDFVNILYSGGDDVFAVGRWDLILEFAKDIQESFKAFVSNKLTLSAGVAMIGGKFPISKGAELAGEAEHQAKDFISADNIPKNAISLFNEVVGWDKEFEAVYKLKNIVKDWLNESEETGISKGLIYKILRFKQIKDEGKHDWRWQSAYYFARLQKNKDKSKQAFKFLKEVFFAGHSILKIERNNKTEELNFKFTSERAIDLLAIASRWASLELRNE